MKSRGWSWCVFFHALRQKDGTLTYGLCIAAVPTTRIWKYENMKTTVNMCGSHAIKQTILRLVWLFQKRPHALCLQHQQYQRTSVICEFRSIVMFFNGCGWLLHNIRCAVSTICICICICAGSGSFLFIWFVFVFVVALHMLSRNIYVDFLLYVLQVAGHAI